MHKVHAPWNAVQIAYLQGWQSGELHLHEYTCPRAHAGDPASPTPLIPTAAGWICSDSDCYFTQDWYLA